MPNDKVKNFSDIDEALMAYDEGDIKLQSPITVSLEAKPDYNTRSLAIQRTISSRFSISKRSYDQKENSGCHG